MNNVFYVSHVFASCVIVVFEIGLNIEWQAPELLSCAYFS